MNELMIKEVDFEGTTLLACKNEMNEKIYVGVSWVCNGLGMSKSLKDTQVKKVQSDYVLNRGCVKFDAGVFDKNNETLAIELDYLPLWLAKINITPSMKNENPILVENLINYQLKAKEVLANAFVRNVTQIVPKTYKEALLALIENIEEKEKLEEQLNLQAPKVESFDTFIDAEGFYNIEQVGKLLGFGRNKMYKYLRDKEVLKKNNLTYQRFIDSEYFVVKENTLVKGEFVKVHTQTFVTPKGLTYIEKLVNKSKNL